MKNIIIILLILSIYKIHSQWVTDAYIPDTKVNDDSTMSAQSGSRIGVDTTGNFVIAWNDCRNFYNNQYTQVFCQLFNKEGVRVGSNFKIGQDTTQFVDVGKCIDGRFIIFWLNIINNTERYQLFFQRFDKNGNPISNPKNVVDSNYSYGGFAWGGGGGIKTDYLGNFIICWSEIDSIGSIYASVHFQRFDSSGNRIGSVQRVNETNCRALNPQINIYYSGNIFITWNDDRTNLAGKNYVYLQRYNSIGVKTGNNIKVNDDTNSTVNHQYPWISSGGIGTFIICWTDERISEIHPKIMYQIYDVNGNPMGLNRIANTTTNGLLSFSKVSMREDGYFFIGWTDYATSLGKYLGCRFDNNGNAYGIPSNPYFIPLYSSSQISSGCNDISLINDKVFSTWGDNRNGNGDIFINVRGFQNPDTVLGIRSLENIPTQFKIFQPYPNPFNSETIISYELPVKNYVNIYLYDVLGRLVKVIINGNQSAGKYSVKLESTNLASGIYFYKIQAGNFVDGRKVVLIK